MTTKTLEQKLAEAIARVDTIKAQIAARDAQANIAEGTIVSFKYGRGETVRTLSGKVVGVDKEGGRVVVLVGIDPYRIFFRDIIGQDTSDTDSIPEVVEEAPAVINDGAVADQDPLAEA